MSLNASDINRAIKAKYSGDQWRVWFEVSQSTGVFSGRRADAVVMNIWPSKGYQLHVFEVKISRADFKKEMADLSKWQAIGQYGDFFWLACPAGLVMPNEVPEAWGLMELTKRGLRIKKQAPARADPAPIDRGFAASLLRSGMDLTADDIQRRVDENVEAARAGIEEVARLKHETEATRLNMRLRKMEAWKAEFEASYGVPPNVHAAPSDMAARISLATRIERKDFDRLASQARSLSDLIEQIEPSRKGAA